MNPRPWRAYALALCVSLLLHIALMVSFRHAAHEAPPTPRHPLEMSMVHHDAPPPPPPHLPTLRTTLHPRLNHHARAPSAHPHTHPSQDLPPPNQTPPPDPPKQPVVPVFGISLSSTSTDSSFAVPVGSTLMAEPHGSSAPPHPYAVPEYEVSERPRRLGECVASYPEEAKRQGIEGRVTLDVEVLADGRVGEVHLVRGLGHGLDEAATEALKQCRFRPAKLGDTAVATRIQYIYNFIIES